MKAKSCCVVLVSLLVLRGEDRYKTWSDYAGSADSLQYSALDQINKKNVKGLKLVWSHAAPGPGGRFAFNPLVVDNMMYVVGKDSSIYGLDAATGKQIWVHPVEDTPTNRGFNYWQSKDGSDRRIIFAVSNNLQEVNARTGVTINTFGNDGKVDLREAVPRAGQSGTPGRVFEDLIILGSAVGEGYGSAKGTLRAYDVRNGKLKWLFRTIPEPGDFGYDTWPKEAYKYIGGVNAWGEISIDEKRGIVYFPLGSPTYDYYGADRKGANLFGNCLLALDARTGKRLWHYQLVHHDLWDYDLNTAPKLLTITHKGKKVDVVAQGTKFGMLYVFNRVTGEPIYPIEERAVPKSDAPGEESWPTQPHSTLPPYARLKFTPAEINPFVDEAEKQRLTEILSKARNEGVFTPLSHLRDQISIPGELGGTNWGGIAADPTNGMLYVRSIDGPAIHRLRTTEREIRLPEDASLEQQGFALYTQHCSQCHGPDRVNIRPMKELGVERFKGVVRKGQAQMPPFPVATLSDAGAEAIAAYLTKPELGKIPEQPRRGAPAPPPPAGQVRYYGQFGSLWHASNGMPAIGPPWAELVAYDLNAGTISWRVPLGTVSSLAAKGITNTGSYRPTRNGPVVTAGGLIFMATASDRMVRAYDKNTGAVLWEQELEANPDGIPAVYMTGGRQYVAFFAGANRSYSELVWKRAKPEAQGYYVFALPVAQSAR